jgi:hypothetical protein
LNQNNGLALRSTKLNEQVLDEVTVTGLAEHAQRAKDRSEGTILFCVVLASESSAFHMLSSAGKTCQTRQGFAAGHKILQRELQRLTYA